MKVGRPVRTEQQRTKHLNVLLNATAYRNDMWLLCTYYLL